MSDYVFEPVPAVEILVALNPTILVRDMEIDLPGVELSREGLDTLYFRTVVQKAALVTTIARAIDCEAEGVLRDLAEYLRTSGWKNQLAAKYAEAFVTVSR